MLVLLWLVVCSPITSSDSVAAKCVARTCSVRKICPRSHTAGAVKTLGSTLTAPAVWERGQIFLTEHVLATHFAATLSEDVIGLHTTSQSNTSMWASVELDVH